MFPQDTASKPSEPTNTSQHTKGSAEDAAVVSFTRQWKAAVVVALIAAVIALIVAFSEEHSA